MYIMSTLSSSFVSGNIKQCNHHQLLVLLFISCVLLSAYFTSPANGITIGSGNNTMCNEHEREALLKFKHGIRVDSCGLLSTWGDHPNCCEWAGVRCNNNTGRVIALNLRGSGDDGRCLEGELGSSVAELKHLRHLDLSFNDFHSQPIPSFIGSLEHLTYLNLSSSFSGEIPPQLENLSNLVYLDLNDGLYFTRSLSWLSRLSMLRIINLAQVDLSKATDWLQVVNNLPFLRALDLSWCMLPPPDSRQLSYKQNSSTTSLSFLKLKGNELNNSSIIFGWLFNLSGVNTHLTHLDLSQNELGGPLPSAFGNLLALSYLDLSVNDFQGNIPSSFFNMRSLSYLDLSENNFQSLPKTVGYLCSLQELILHSNNFTDNISNIIQLVSGCTNNSLSSLSLWENRIWGSLDQDLVSTFPSLRELDLSYNQLSGMIPQSLGQLSTLESLDLYSNRLEGNLSNIHFANLVRLRELGLGNNSGLAFNMDDVDWVPPFHQLDYIDLSSCRLGPLFPKWLLSQTNYSYLDISNAGISDSIPESFWNSFPSEVETLNMSHNMLHGIIPDLTKLQRSLVGIIDLSFNKLEGVIPSSFASNISSLFLNNNSFSNSIPFMCPKFKSQLTVLDLSNNLLSTKLPDCWMNYPYLKVLHLQNNNFSGGIPPSIGYMKRMESLKLRNNAIFGALPRSLLENLTSLLMLDLGHNSLSGRIPSSFGTNFKSLGILRE